MGHQNYKVLRPTHAAGSEEPSAAALQETLLMACIHRSLESRADAGYVIHPSESVNERMSLVAVSTVQGAGRGFDCGGNIPIDFKAILPPVVDLTLSDGVRIRFDFSYASRCI